MGIVIASLSMGIVIAALSHHKLFYGSNERMNTKVLSKL